VVLQAVYHSHRQFRRDLKGYTAVDLVDCYQEALRRARISADKVDLVIREMCFRLGLTEPCSPGGNKRWNFTVHCAVTVNVVWAPAWGGHHGCAEDKGW